MSKPIITIYNGHVDDAPELGEVGTSPRYVSYFQTEIGEQLIFIREKDADHGLLYAGDMAWEPYKVKRHTDEEIRAALAADVEEGDAELRPETIESMVKTAVRNGRLVPTLMLAESEMSWLSLSWRASCGIHGEERDYEALGREFADMHWSPAFLKWPTSNDYMNERRAWFMTLGAYIASESITGRSQLEFVKAVYARENEIYELEKNDEDEEKEIRGRRPRTTKKK